MPDRRTGGTRCPRCRSTVTRRCHRAGAGERLLSVAYVYPFRCQACGARFRALRWGTRYPRVMAERREYERAPVRVPVRFRSADGAGDGEIVYVSVNGCTVRTERVQAVDARLRLELEPGAGKRPIVVDAAIVRSARPGAMGLEFVSVAPAHTAAFRDFIHTALAVPDGTAPPGPALVGPLRVRHFWILALAVLAATLSLIALVRVP